MAAVSAMQDARIEAASLGSAEFRAAYGLKYAYLAGAMYKGIASKEMVVALGRAGLMGYFGAGGLRPAEIEAALRFIQAELADGQPYGMNLLCNAERPEAEEQVVDMYLRHGVTRVEAAAYVQMTPALVRFRLKGVTRDAQGHVRAPRRVLAKVSRPEVAAAFLQPPPEALVARLVAAGTLCAEEAELAAGLPMADELCVEADSGGHTDGGVAYALMPAMSRLRDDLCARHGYPRRVAVGAAGGIGTPQAAAAAFVLGADFVLTGSVNQCTVEAGTSDDVKELLAQINVQDTAYAPAGDMFEVGARVQVLKRGLFFPARANRLYELYQRHDSLDDLDPGLQRQIQEKYFGRSFAEVWAETEAYYRQNDPRKLAEIARSPKQKMAAVFKWYFVHSSRLALRGEAQRRVDYQVHCGPALGAFNQWVKGTPLENWRNRRVVDVAELIMQEAARWLNQRCADFTRADGAGPTS